MRVKIKKVYYCDYCNKHYLTKAVLKHEKHCTANPNRECRLCENNNIYDTVQKYKKKIIIENNTINLNINIDKLTDELEGCPVCILTVIRCINPDKLWVEPRIKFSFKEELEKWWQIKNEEWQEEEERYLTN